MGNTDQASYLALPGATDVATANAILEPLIGKEGLARWSLVGGKVTAQSYARRDLQRSEVRQTVFERCDFSDVAANGIRWPDNTFVDCRFDRSDLEYGDLSRCHFIGLAPGGGSEQEAMISGAGFNGVVLRDATLEGVVSKASSFAYADFTGATISGCDLNGTFEGCLFHHVRFSDTSFVNSNVSYADFTGAVLSNVSVGLSDLPYLLGILCENIGSGLTVVAHNAETGVATTIDGDQFKDIGRHLIQAHLARQDFFAATNLAFMLDDRDHLLPLAKEGLRASWLREDYRELKLLCKLIRHMEDRTRMFGRGTLRRLYDLITTNVGNGDEAAQRQYELHDGQIRGYLLAAAPDSLFLEFESLADTPEAANQLTGEIIQALNQVISAAELGVEITASEYSFNSNPRHIIELRIVRDQASLPPVASSGPSPWWGIAIGLIGLLFNGVSTMRPFFEQQQRQPTVVIQNIVNEYRPRIESRIVPETLILKQGGLPLTTWEGGGFALTGHGSQSPGGKPPARLTGI